jgi:5-methylcytosine-specific restriction endonuclease McrA
MGYTGDKKREYQLAFVTKRRKDWIKSKGGKCATCGSTRNLEVDHKNPDGKEKEPRDIWSASDDVREKELKHCQVLCKSCHEKKTAKENSGPMEMALVACGTDVKYDLGCRCFGCREEHILMWRDSRTSDTL